MNPEFWRDKKVFLTGHTGFKGSWLALWLEHVGARVHGFALEPPTDPSLFQRAAVDRGITSTIADIRDFHLLSNELERCKPDVVLHLAAQSIVLRSYEDPLETFSTNVIGTANLLNAVRRLDAPCAVVNVTTDKVYENQRWVWGYRESDPLGGRDPYSGSKACAELVSRAFWHSYFAPDPKRGSRVGLANARAGNVIGGGDWTPHQLIPDTVQAFASGRPVILRHPEAVRPWQHVLDCLSGYLVLAEALYESPERYSTDWNFGPADGDMRPVADVVALLGRHWGVEKPWERDQAHHAHEELELRLTSQKSNRQLNWIPKLSLDHALGLTADWYMRHFAGEDARDLCLRQIESYMTQAG